MDDSIRILVVDDEADIRRIIRILLESRGYRVLEAPNGRLAVETIRKEPDIDLILLDIMMPELSGIEASREIRSISSAPILFLTARTRSRISWRRIHRAAMTIWQSRFPMGSF